MCIVHFTNVGGLYMSVNGVTGNETGINLLTLVGIVLIIGLSILLILIFYVEYKQRKREILT